MIDLRKQLGDTPGAIVTTTDMVAIWTDAFDELAAVDPAGVLKSLRVALGALSLLIQAELEIERDLVDGPLQ